MPEIVIYAIAGRTTEQKRALVKDMTDAMVKNFGVTAEGVSIHFVEADKDSKAKGGKLYSDR